MRFVKKNWKASLIVTLLIFGLLIGGGFYLDQKGLVPTAVPTTIVAIMAPTVYYIYSEVLNRPLISVEKNDQPLSVAPMFMPVDVEQLQEVDEVDTPTSQILRPAVFYRLSIENDGKATAQNAMVHIRLNPEDDDHPDFDYYARWSDPGNSDRYDLLPGQTRNALIMKVFLTQDFFPIVDLTQNQSLPADTGVDTVNPSGNPAGQIRFFSDIEKEDISPHPLIPREQPPERAERSTHGGWAGQDMYTRLESIDATYTVEARIIADNYKTEWKKQMDTISISGLVKAVQNDDIWQNQWDQQGNLKQEVQIAVSDWLNS
ncbi:hypothetical protein ELS19_12490 [Halogeometricum borinquense]|uniref:Uncharacterized protein n=1 Tax=Halogeometricum borinquense TaxID=60847 RepID=A0A482TCX1_9EURY|nr:hypothetical protein [Halogeometricum borinquense]RYJ14687.1 hypothetical protein ELS19_12490 [Halogeometricum borinquense]